MNDKTEQQQPKPRMALVTLVGRGSFTGRIHKEHSSGFDVVTNEDPLVTEWFAKDSEYCKCVEVQ